MYSLVNYLTLDTDRLEGSITQGSGWAVRELWCTLPK